MFAVLPTARKLLSRLTILLALTWLAACQPTGLTGTGGGPSINPSAPVPVALLVPHGAADENEQKLARDLENAARMAASDLQGVQIDLRIYGTAGQPEKAREAALAAVSDGARIIVGPLHAEAARAAAAAAGRGVNVLAFSNNTRIAGGNLFVLGHTFENSARRLTRYAVSRGKSRFLAVHAENLAGDVGRAAIETAVLDTGAQLVGSVSHAFNQDDVIGAVPRIVEEAEAGEADAVFLASNTAGALPLFTQMLPESGLDPDEVQYIGLTRWDKPPQTLALPGVQGGWFALPDPAKSAAFQARFKEAHGAAPHAIAGLAYDGIAAIGALVRQGRRDALTHGGLTQPAGFQGVEGVFRLRADGTNERGLAVATVIDRKVEVIDPAPQGFGRSGF
ncbi:penicillin-binding protein activator [Roseovarius sp. TE539]|uniref:penicillin-binding protein activator n=1 Tax=Roseovarius sp. TE539 TaxID=2249812 RepID=UPI000DDF0870|nr:penicillin-binding protein activator [Roseovarius sp. TE539]RBI72328.1 penicillin-binding protein activator [Roseovarius sp. TE539]